MRTRTRSEVRPPRREPPRGLLRHDLAAVVAAGLIACGIGAVVIDDPGLVAIEIDNPTAYDLHVEARSTSSDGWLPLAVLGHGTTRTVAQVIDLGRGTWTFRFTGQASEAGTAEWSRAELESANWHIEVPAAIARSLRSKGAPPSPPS